MEFFLHQPTRSAALLNQYIDDFGDRCACELKLESETYRTNPLLLAETVSAFTEAPLMQKSAPPKLHGLARLYAKKAYSGILLREKSRMSRGKIFGLIREIVLKCGNALSARGAIARQRDVFYLTFDELGLAVHGKTAGLRETVETRRRQWDAFAALPPYTRLVFDSKVFDKHTANCIAETVCSGDALICGTPCSSGIAEGEITHISGLTADTDASGKIILADITDPGWVFVISQSLGIISKRGSLLSHTAIISRELKKPAVVGVGNACDHFRDGDYVRLNGMDGTVQLIRRAS
jgi:pyruvate,water dikinase